MTNKVGILTAGIAASMMSMSAASASTVIDDFTDLQSVADLPTIGVNSSTAAGGMIGGFRYLEADNRDGFNNGTSLNSQNGFLTFNNSSLTSGIGYIVYDGTPAADRPALATDNSIGTGVNTGGLGGLDLVQGSESKTFFSFDLSGFNPGSGGSSALFSAFAWDTSGNRADFFEIVGASDISPNLFLDEFGGASIDWTQVGALAFSIDSRPTPAGSSPVGVEFGGANFDGAVGAITISAVPLPASVLMLLAGLGGFAGLSAFAARRREEA